MPGKIWVKAAHPRASFYQEVLENSEDGGPAELKIEHVHAPTVLRDGHPDHSKQIPVPMQVTDTAAVRVAMLEKLPGTDRPARIVACEPEEVAAHLKSKGIEADAKPDRLAAARAAKAAKAAAAAKE